MTLRYKNEFLDYLAQYHLINHAGYAPARTQYFRALLVPIGVGVLGIIGSYPESIFVTCLIIVSLALYLHAVLPFSENYQAHVDAAISAVPEKEIELEIDDKGFHERIEGIESFCPWSSMVGYYQFRKCLLVEMNANLWAIIPSRSLTRDSPNLEEVIACLEKHGVAEKPAPLT